MIKEFVLEIRHTKHDHFWLYGMKMWTEPTLPYGIYVDRMLHEVKKRRNVQGPNTQKGFGRAILDREICI